MSNPKIDIAEQDESNDGTVVYLESYSETPEPSKKLKLDGRKVYDEWCRNLIAVGRLTVESLTHVTNLGVATDMMIWSIDNNYKNMRSATDLERSSLMKLGKLNADKSIPVSAQNNPFRDFGFARRAKEKLHE